MNLSANFPQLGTPLVDPQTGRLTQAWYLFLAQIFNRTGKEDGVSAASLQSEIDTLTGDYNTQQQTLAALLLRMAASEMMQAGIVPVQSSHQAMHDLHMQIDGFVTNGKV